MNTLPVRFFGLLLTLHFLMFEFACAIGETSAATAAQSTELQNSTSARATGQSKPPLPVVIFTTWRDPREGAFTLSVPEGWQVNGGAMRGDARQSCPDFYQRCRHRCTRSSRSVKCAAVLPPPTIRSGAAGP
jgi:hypothetical protein